MCFPGKKPRKIGPRVGRGELFKKCLPSKVSNSGGALCWTKKLYFYTRFLIIEYCINYIALYTFQWNLSVVIYLIFAIKVREDIF